MRPSGYMSEEVASELVRQLANWVRPRRLGRVTGSGAGFVLPNADVRAPDVSFVRAERLRRSPLGFVELAPDLVADLRRKIDSFLEQGTRVGILVDPEQRWVEVRRVGDGDVLAVPELLPGWAFPIADLWPPLFEPP